ncbi:MAG: zinc ribbon domain-containing protein [Clostridia bacterium]|nr:zinc ribbon domain-containing protein [Clostridia bacterium]
MKCNICGAELGADEKVCRYCGNDMRSVSNYKKTEKRRSELHTPRAAMRKDVVTAARVRTGDESIVVRPTAAPHNKFCAKCGRLLDIKTHRCPACDERERALIRTREENIRDASVRTKRAEDEKRKKQKKANITIAVIMTLAAVFVITAFTFFKLIGGGEGPDDVVVTIEPKPTEITQETEMPIIDDGNGEVHWKPTNE